MLTRTTEYFNGQRGFRGRCMILSFLLAASTVFHASPLTAAVGSLSVRSLALHSLGFVEGSKKRAELRVRMTRDALASEDMRGAKADVWLKKLGVDFKVIEQSKATAKCRDSALERGLSLRQIVKSIVFIEQSEMESGPTRLDGTAHLLQAMLPGCEVGAVHPFASGVSVRLFDHRLTEHPTVSFNTGDMTRGVLISPVDLIAALGDQVRVCDLAADASGDDRAEELAAELGLALHDARFIADTPGAEEYFAAYTAAIAALAAAPAAGPTSPAAEATPMHWLRLLSRLAAGAGAGLSRVPPAWLAALAVPGGATRYAREDALRRFAETGADPGLPAPAAPADGAGDAASALVAEVLGRHRGPYAEWLAAAPAAGGGWDERRSGKLATFLMGDAMKACRGALPPQAVRAALLDRMRADHAAAAGAPAEAAGRGGG